MATGGAKGSQEDDLVEIYTRIDTLIASPNYGRSSLDKLQAYLPGYNQYKRQQTASTTATIPRETMPQPTATAPIASASTGSEAVGEVSSRKSNGCCSLL